MSIPPRSRQPTTDPRIDRALSGLEELVRSHFPQAVFDVSHGDDPPGTYLWATVDVEDTDDVMNVVVDRLLEIQVDDQLPIYFVPQQPAARCLANIHRPHSLPASAYEKTIPTPLP